MMADYEYQFAVLLQQRLKSKIQGGIYVTVAVDELIVKVIRDETIDFKYSFYVVFKIYFLNNCLIIYNNNYVHRFIVINFD